MTRTEEISELSKTEQIVDWPLLSISSVSTLGIILPELTSFSKSFTYIVLYFWRAKNPSTIIHNLLNIFNIMCCHKQGLQTYISDNLSTTETMADPRDSKATLLLTILLWVEITLLENSTWGHHYYFNLLNLAANLGKH